VLFQPPKKERSAKLEFAENACLRAHTMRFLLGFAFIFIIFLIPMILLAESSGKFTGYDSGEETYEHMIDGVGRVLHSKALLTDKEVSEIQRKHHAKVTADAKGLSDFNVHVRQPLSTDGCTNIRLIRPQRITDFSLEKAHQAWVRFDRDGITYALRASEIMFFKELSLEEKLRFYLNQMGEILTQWNFSLRYYENDKGLVLSYKLGEIDGTFGYESFPFWLGADESIWENIALKDAVIKIHDLLEGAKLAHEEYKSWKIKKHQWAISLEPRFNYYLGQLRDKGWRMNPHKSWVVEGRDNSSITFELIQPGEGNPVLVKGGILIKHGSPNSLSSFVDKVVNHPVATDSDAGEKSCAQSIGTITNSREQSSLTRFFAKLTD